MAMVRTNTSSLRMAVTRSDGRMSRELTMARTRKPIANHGTGSLAWDLPSAPAAALARSQKPSTSRTGTSKATRVILTMVATSVVAGSMLLAAPTTWATSCTVPPI
ncbi:Uncharacterised protein [Bordetella pertussis]|nr:Uncharacterised protein [Bordetella pertussis]